MLGECLLAWIPPPPDADGNAAKAGAIVIGEFVNLVRNALKKK